jgi:3-methylfumaryl-CoA hydratase
MQMTDSLDATRANALSAALGRPERFAEGDDLPPFFHHIYFWDARAPDLLGRDGHPKVGDGLIPDLGLPRRMWAGGQLQFFNPLRCGTPAQKHSHCIEATHKTGRTGPLAFVTLQHDIEQDGTVCVTERQTLVDREDPSPGDRSAAPAPVTPPATAQSRQPLRFDTTLLFRYSALTFNGHRIHYDADYARDQEGYDNLVVHGPLLAQLMMLDATARLGPLTQFEFKGVAALTLGTQASLCSAGRQFWIESDGRVHMLATA